MFDLMRRFAALILMLGALLVLPAASQAAYLTGFSDQQAAMFDHPLFAPLHTKIARYTVPWDVMKRADDRARLDAWLAGARRLGIRPLVSFYVSRKTPLRLPSSTQFDREFRKFRAAYPDVKDISPWNEANAARRGRFANPGPRQAATFFKIVKRRCSGCTIVGLDVLDSTNIKATVRYIKQFKNALKGRGLPKVWGLHNYSDTNRFRNKGTKAVLAAVKGQVWLTETGGVVRFGRAFPYNEARAARAIKYMFKLAASNPRLKRLYIYQWHGSPRSSSFDSGVVGIDGRPRPSYFAVKGRLAPGS
jgi:hypothetical protein